MPWKDHLKGYPLDWLLEYNDPSVRYWALQDLMYKTPEDPEVKMAQDEIMGSNKVRAILNAQDPQGHWFDPENMYLPKYRATTHSLLILAELGARRTPAIERGVEHLFLFQRDSGHFLMKMPKTSRGRSSKVTDGCCLDANVLYYLNRFGYFDDSRTQRTIQFLIEDHDPKNAGWRCRAYPINPDGVFPTNCYMGAAKVLKAFASIPEKRRTPAMGAVIKREVESVLENAVYKYLRNPEGSQKEKAGWKRFGFPLFYQSDVLEVLDALTTLGVRDPRMKPAIELVEEAQQKNGAWILKNTFNGKMWADIEIKHKPSKWITLKALRVLRRYYEK